ncbi:MAG: diacylglycerol kinase family lipid kinase [Solirubrobacterales bacterium]|nr:diacylglycerol kinase family lipid kinase [Solirubrobacterales bacterium]
MIANPSSGGGKGKDLLPEVERALDQNRLAFRTVVTHSLEHGVDEALGAAEAGEVPVVISGDGLIGQIGGALARSDTPLGIVPGGRGNDLARVLEIPTEVPDAVRVLAAGHEREIDVGEVNGRRFLCIASMGFDSEANRIANEARLIRGNLVYAYAALRALVAWRPATFTIEYDGDRRTYKGYAAAVANSRAFGGGMFIAPGAELDDGRFDIVMSGDVSKFRFLANLPKVFKGTHIEEPEVRVVRAAHAEVRASRNFQVYADGEHLTDLPATLRVLPRALRVIVPATSQR